MHLLLAGAGRAAAGGLALVAATLAADGLVLKTSLFVELLFGDGEGKGLSAIAAIDGLVFHIGFFP